MEDPPQQAERRRAQEMPASRRRDVFINVMTHGDKDTDSIHAKKLLRLGLPKNPLRILPRYIGLNPLSRMTPSPFGTSLFLSNNEKELIELIQKGSPHDRFIFQKGIQGFTPRIIMQMTAAAKMYDPAPYLFHDSQQPICGECIAKFAVHS